MSGSFSRRHALGLGAALAAGTAVGPLGRPVAASVSRTRTASTYGLGRSAAAAEPVSMAMHLHASFSEGIASMSTHLDQARRTGVDVIWWTEHDFRLQAHGYVQEVHFDGLTESRQGIDWTWTASQSGTLSTATGTFVTDPHTPDEPGKALRLTATGPADGWGRLQYEGTAWNDTYSTGLGNTTLELDVLAESLGPDAELLVEIFSSYRPASGGRPAGQYTMQYRLGAATGRSTEQSGLLGVVASQLGTGWQRLMLRPVDDFAAIWPDLVAGDASLYRLRLAVRARRGGTAKFVVDRLRFVRDRRADQEALQLQDELIAAYAVRYPDVRQIQAVELSLVRHLNAFGGTVFLPDYGDGPPIKDNSVGAAMAMVGQAHAHGALASYNHPLENEVSNRQDLAKLLIQTRNLGADILEVGTTQAVDDVTFAFDAAARNGVYVTATGVSDDHAGTNWLGQKYRWITSAWAASSETAELQDALSRGRVWFADPAKWGGAIDIDAREAPAMGGVLVTPDATVPMKVTVEDLPKKSTLELITGEADFAGTAHAEPATTTVRVAAAAVKKGRVKFDFAPGGGRYVRATVRDGGGRVIGFSNPTWVFPTTPPGGIPAQRQL